MRGKCGYRRNLVRTSAHSFAAVPAVFRREHEFLLYRIVVTHGPTIVASGLQEHHLFGRQRSLLSGFVESRPIRVQLIAPVLGHKYASAGIHGKAFGIADSRGEALLARKLLVCSVRVVP